MAVEAALEDRVDAAAAVGGGCINEAARVTLASGATVFVKWGRHAHPDVFEREAEGLAAMRAAESGLVIPAPVAWGRDFLVMDWLEPAPRRPDFEARLGEGLARLHLHQHQQQTATAPRFGFAHDNYCGATVQPNGWMDTWVPFWRERRLSWQLRICEDRRGFSSSDRRLLESVVSRLEALLGTDPEPPALIHGDLWSGNLHVAPGGHPSLVDPAAYFGHREAELGMMVLFGGFSSRVFEAYEGARPLQPDWRARLPLYSLWHVLNHYYLFGGGYGAQAVSIARTFQ